MDASAPGSARIVAHTKDGKLYKGYAVDAPELNPQALGSKQPAGFPARLTLQVEETGATVQIERQLLKAVFFVRTFEGRKDYNEIKFFEAHPPVEGLWVRLRYLDSEITEGVVYNSLDLLTDPGFFLKPPDPNSNNQIVYVLKDSLREFRVLGVKGTY